MEIIFKILCGILYCIGVCFGLTYKEISVYICIYACPAICVAMAAMTCLVYYDITKLRNRLVFSVNFALLIMYYGFARGFWAHYGWCADPFDLCQEDLLRIASELNLTYEYVNIFIYCYLFFGIIAFHLIQILLKLRINKRNKKQSNATLPHNSKQIER